MVVRWVARRVLGVLVSFTFSVHGTHMAMGADSGLSWNVNFLLVEARSS
jgi:hypothetical protein